MEIVRGCRGRQADRLSKTLISDTESRNGLRCIFVGGACLRACVLTLRADRGKGYGSKKKTDTIKRVSVKVIYHISQNLFVKADKFLMRL